MSQYYESADDNKITNLDYDIRTDGQPVYLGRAERGTLSSEGKWLIYYFTYNASDNMITKRMAIGVWDNRTSLIYT